MSRTGRTGRTGRKGAASIAEDAADIVMTMTPFWSLSITIPEGGAEALPPQTERCRRVTRTFRAFANGSRSQRTPRGRDERKADGDRVDRVLMMLLMAGSIAAGAVAMHALDAMTGR
jgi:hypothetical protein